MWTQRFCHCYRVEYLPVYSLLWFVLLYFILRVWYFSSQTLKCYIIHIILNFALGIIEIIDILPSQIFKYFWVLKVFYVKILSIFTFLAKLLKNHHMMEGNKHCLSFLPFVSGFIKNVNMWGVNRCECGKNILEVKSLMLSLNELI